MSRKSKMRMASVMVLAAAAMPVVALGQYQTANNTGRRLDANNRLGSGGMNDSRQAVGGVSADDIVYGNVTRGQAFQGELNSTDATRFRGNLDRPSDNLVRDAGPSVYGRGGSSDQYSAQAFFGDNRGVRRSYVLLRVFL